jgi:hypothetical protein
MPIPLNVSGYIPSPLSVHDIPLSAAMPSIVRYPKEMLCPFDLKVKDQGNTPHCVGYASALIKEFNELKERDPQSFDGDYLYNECKKIDGIPQVEGTYYRSAMSVLRNVGIVPIGKTDPSPYKIGAYAKVDDISFENLKKTIFLYGIVLAGFTGCNLSWKDAYIKPITPGQKLWGHGVALIGYNENYLIGQNSWGEDWGENGLFYISKDYLMNLQEAWTVLVDLPNISSGLIGWVASQYLLDATTISKTTTTANLNLREYPSLSAKVIKILPKGTSVSVGSEESMDGFRWNRVTVL